MHAHNPVAPPGDELLAAVPELRGLEDPAARAVLAASRLVHLPAGTAVFRDGDACRDYMLLVSGSVRIQKVGDSGREIVLYRLHPGQGCVLTTSCLLAGRPYPAEGVAEDEVTALAIPHAAFERGLAESPSFRRFVFSTYSRRLAELITLIEAVAFGRFEVRLAHYLVHHAPAEGPLRLTHGRLAQELGSAREVVSRQLKDFERRGLVRLQRGAIVVNDRDALARLAQGQTL